MRLLADTSALLALWLQNDQNHDRAAEFVRRTPSARFLLTDLILAEVATRLRARTDAKRAVAAVRELLRSERYGIVYLDEAMLRGALERMERYADKRLSLADCASFEVMGRLGLEAAFAFDRDFRDCGFAMKP